MHTKSNRILWTVFAVLAVVLALSASLDQWGKAQGAEALKRALVTFAVSRALNGAISVAQGTELALEPAGVGVILSIGQLLDPINDLVERFSTVMLVASTSLGVQNVLMRITSSWGFDVALGLAAALAIAAFWLPSVRLRSWSVVAQRLFLLVLFVRFAVPVVVVATGFVFDRFLEQEQQAAVAAIEATQTQIDEINEERVTAIADPSLLDRLNMMVDETIDMLDVRERLKRLQDQVANASEHIINLIVIFVLQTVLLPIAFLWLFVEILKTAARRVTHSQ